MEKLHLLRLKELSVEPNAPESTKVFKFWLRTVEYFIAGLREGRAEGQSEIDKKIIIVSYFLAEIFPYVEDCETYHIIVAILWQIFVMEKNNIFARHCLVSRWQDSEESITEFLLSLKQLAKECTFSNVTANEYREKLIRPPRLLENDILTLTRAVELADTLDRSFRQSSFVSTSNSQLMTVPDSNKDLKLSS